MSTWLAPHDQDRIRALHEYCVKDPAIVERALKQLLAAQFDGQMPHTENGAKKLARYAPQFYRTEWQKPDGLKQLEALLIKRFNNPVVKKKRGSVTADVGVVPFVPAVKDGNVVVESSEYFSSGNSSRPKWKGPGLGRALQALSVAHPSAQLILMKARLPGRTSARTKSLSTTTVYAAYSRRMNQLVLLDNLGKQTTRNFARLPKRGLAAVIDGEVSIAYKDLERCSWPKTIDFGDEGREPCAL